MVKNLPARQETWVQSLCWEDLLEEEMATHSGRLQSLGLQRVWHCWATNTTHHFLKILCSKATNHTITQIKTYAVLFLVGKALFSPLCSPIFCPCFKAQLKTQLSWKLSHHSLANASFLSWIDCLEPLLSVPPIGPCCLSCYLILDLLWSQKIVN